MARITKPAPVNKSTSKQRVAEESNRATNGNDVLSYGVGNDVIDAGGGNDIIYGNHGHDNINGGSGKDKIWGGHGNDSLSGGTKETSTGLIVGDGERDDFYFMKLDGAQSNGAHQDYIYLFEKGVDKINLSDLTNGDTYQLSSDGTSSYIRFLSNTDMATTIVVDNVIISQSDIVTRARLDNQVTSVAPVNTPPVNTGSATPVNPGATPPSTTVNVVTGSDRVNDSLVGKIVDDQINGLGGNDLLYGNHGNDTIYGGAGADKIWGGHGNDLLIGGSASAKFDRSVDTFYFDKSDGEQRDTIEGFETGRDKINLSLSNKDICIVEQNNGDSIIRYNSFDSNGIDSVRDGDIISPNGAILPSATIVVSGVSIASNDIVTNARKIVIDEKNNSITGTLGNDAINGKGGNDTIYGDHGNDTLEGGAGADQIWGGHGSDVMYGGSKENLYDGKSDTFYFMKSDGYDVVDRIYGFEIGVDKINILGMSKAQALNGQASVEYVALGNIYSVHYMVNDNPAAYARIEISANQVDTSLTISDFF